MSFQGWCSYKSDYEDECTRYIVLTPFSPMLIDRYVRLLLWLVVTVVSCLAIVVILGGDTSELSNYRTSLCVTKMPKQLPEF